jgi:hypothetical protein
MKITLLKKFMAIALIGFFSQFAMADNASSASEIAGIVVAMNHFPSDADKAKLMAISADDSLAGGIRVMATAVGNISHAANADGKAAMAGIIDGTTDAEAPDRFRALAGVVAGFNHMASADDKAKITELFEL